MTLFVVLIGVSTFHDLSRASFFLSRASRSYEQPALVTRQVADVNAVLLDESARGNRAERKGMGTLTRFRAQ
jgi:hypothetical protein